MASNSNSTMACFRKRVYFGTFMLADFDLQACTGATQMTKLLIDKAVVEQALPCPFCGHVGLDFSEGSTFRWIVAECGGCGASRGETRIKTYGEGSKADWMADAQADAIREWNTRASIAQAEPSSVEMHVPEADAKHMKPPPHAVVWPSPQAEQPVVVPRIQPVAVVIEQLDQNEARIRWMFDPVPEGEVLQWDHNGMLSASTSPAPAVPDAAKPTYPPDDGPMTDEQIGRIKSVTAKPVHDRSGCSSGTEDECTNRSCAGGGCPALKASKPETQGERKELARRLRLVAPKMEEFGHRGWAELCEQAAALLSAGPARVEPLTDGEILAARMGWLNAPVVQDSAFVSGVKFAERHHGIGNDQV